MLFQCNYLHLRQQINFFRTASFSCILWTSVLVAILSDTNAAGLLGPLAVLCIIVGGWGLIIALYLLVYFAYYKQPIEYYYEEEQRSIRQGRQHSTFTGSISMRSAHMDMSSSHGSIRSGSNTNKAQDTTLTRISKWFWQR